MLYYDCSPVELLVGRITPHRVLSFCVLMLVLHLPCQLWSDLVKPNITVQTKHFLTQVTLNSQLNTIATSTYK